MAVEQIKAWQISSGQTYASKKEAYHEEKVYLLTTRGSNGRLTLDLASFDEAVRDQQALVADLIKMREPLDGRSDKTILKELDALLVDADTWLASATALRTAMDND